MFRLTLWFARFENVLGEGTALTHHSDRTYTRELPRLGPLANVDGNDHAVHPPLVRTNRPRPALVRAALKKQFRAGMLRHGLLEVVAPQRTVRSTPERFGDDLRRIQAIRVFVARSKALRAVGESARLRSELARAITLAAPAAAASTSRAIEDAVLGASIDPEKAAHVSARLAGELGHVDPLVDTGCAWLRLRFILAAHGLLHASLVARFHARTSSEHYANVADPGHDTLALATFLALDQGDIEAADRHHAHLRSRFREHVTVSQIPALRAIAAGDREMFMQIARGRHGPADREMLELVRGRSVALVGPAPSPYMLAEEIDGFDLVVRLTYAGPDTIGDPSSVGRRTNVSYYTRASHLRHACPVVGDAVVIPSTLAFAVTSFDQDTLRWRPRIVGGAPRRLVGPPVRRGFTPVAQGIFGDRADRFQKLQFALYDLLHFDPGRVKIFNSTFYLSDELFHPGFVSPRAKQSDSSALCDQFARHDPIGNIRFVRNFVEAGWVAADEQASARLSMNDVAYVSGLDELYGSTVSTDLSQGSR